MSTFRDIILENRSSHELDGYRYVLFTNSQTNEEILTGIEDMTDLVNDNPQFLFLSESAIEDVRQLMNTELVNLDFHCPDVTDDVIIAHI